MPRAAATLALLLAAASEGPPVLSVQQRAVAGETVEVFLSSPVASRPGDQAWITVVPPGSRDELWAWWAYLEDGARSAKVPLPLVTGPVEVRLHTGYPKRATNVVARLRLELAPGQRPVPKPLQAGELLLDTRRLVAAPGAGVVVPFTRALPSPELDRFWITVVAPGTPDSAWGAWAWVTDGATSARLRAPDAPGAYEVRLHAGYPTHATNVVARASLVVEAAASADTSQPDGQP